MKIWYKFALRFIKYDKSKSIGIVFGVIVSTFLVGQQTGIFIFLTNAMSSLVDNSKADIWVVDLRTNNANSLGTVDIRIGRQVESIPGVKKAYPIIITGGKARFAGGQTTPVSIIGTQPPLFKGGPFRISRGRLDDLMMEGAVSADEFESRNLNGARMGTQFEINGQWVFIAVQTRGARGFGATYIFTTLDRARTLGNLSREKVNAFLLDLKPGYRAQEICHWINQSIPYIKAWPRNQFSRTTVKTILASSGIAFSVGTLIIFAVIFGWIIIGLTMYSAAIDRLRDYGTLKALGASNQKIRLFILIQALTLALSGYGVGILLLEGFRLGIAKTGVLFDFSPAIKIGFFLLTIGISIGGATFALRRIGKLEPASVFKNL